jgi:hypothetical protein
VVLPPGQLLNMMIRSKTATNEAAMLQDGPKWTSSSSSGPNKVGHGELNCCDLRTNLSGWAVCVLV